MILKSIRENEQRDLFSATGRALQAWRFVMSAALLARRRVEVDRLQFATPTDRLADVRRGHFDDATGVQYLIGLLSEPDWSSH